MKGKATLIITNDQMLEIVKGWWDSKAYANKDKVVYVTSNETGGFVIDMEEMTEEEGK